MTLLHTLTFPVSRQFCIAEALSFTPNFSFIFSDVFLSTEFIENFVKDSLLEMDLSVISKKSSVPYPISRMAPFSENVLIRLSRFPLSSTIRFIRVPFGCDITSTQPLVSSKSNCTY